MDPLPTFGTIVRSLRDEKIVGRVQGYGTLFVDRNIDGREIPIIQNPTVVALVWDWRSPGSNSLINPTVHVLDVNQMELCEPPEKEIV